MKKLLLTITMLTLLSCDKETCPEGTFEWNDAQGNLIECVDLSASTFKNNNQLNSFVQVKNNKILLKKIALLK